MFWKLGDIHINMESRYYTPDDYNTISSWYHLRNLETPPLTHIPPNGIIVPGIACAHLYKTDGNFAFLEGFISNPMTTHQERKDALQLIIKELTKLAKECGYLTIYAMTNHPTISSGCIEAGLEDIGSYTMFEKDI